MIAYMASRYASIMIVNYSRLSGESLHAHDTWSIFIIHDTRSAPMPTHVIWNICHLSSGIPATTATVCARQMTRPSKCNVGEPENSGERVELQVFAVCDNAIVNVANARQISDVCDSVIGEKPTRILIRRAKGGKIQMMSIPEVIARRIA